MYSLQRKCRACENEKLIPVFSLGIQPLANDFCAVEDEHGGYAPLQVLYCPQCSLAQLSANVRPDILYSRYAYVTSPSDTMQRHFERLYSDIIQRTSTAERILEIGSNDGRFLHWISELGHKVCGIDPAENLHPDTVDSICDVFCYGSAEQARLKLGAPADVVIARHVFCHVDDWVDFMKSLEVVCDPDTTIVIEVPYVGKLLAATEWDTIYHEHLSYLSFKAMAALLVGTPFRIFDILDYDIHGGVVAIVLRHMDSTAKPNPEAELRVRNETITEDHWHRFATRAHTVISELHDLVKGLAHSRKKVCAFGASAKATVMLNACRFTSEHIAFVADSTKWKQGKLVPGTDIPITDEEGLMRKMPEYAILGAWNFSNEIMEKYQPYTQKGGKWILTVPEVRIFL